MQLETRNSKRETQIRLGFPVRILGEPRLRSHDGRRWRQRPHLSVSLLYLRDILLYLQRQAIGLYRLAESFAPYLTHPDHPEFHRQLDECAEELALVGGQARQAGVRLSMHLGSHVNLSAPGEEQAARSLAEVEAQALLFAALGLDDAVLVLHPGGRYQDRRGAMERFVGRAAALSPLAQALVAVEHDRIFSLNDAIHLHARSGLPVVFDSLHHQLYNPEGIGEPDGLEYALMTWPAGRRPKIHLATPRTELRLVEARPGQGGQPRAIEQPDPNEHSDYLHPFEAIRLLSLLRSRRPCDVMLEAKAGDLALLRLRHDLRRFAPELAGVVG